MGIQVQQPLKGLNTKEGLENELERMGTIPPDELIPDEELYSMGYSKEQIENYKRHAWNGKQFADEYLKEYPPERIPYAQLIRMQQISEPYMKDVGFEGFGESKYDMRVQSPSDLENINDFRAQEQSGFEQAVHGIAKFGVIAAGTFATGAIATVAGLANIISEASQGKINSFRELGSAFVNDPISKSMAEIYDRMENYLLNYRTQYEQDNPLSNVFTANSIFDGFLKNAGYFVGAALSGRFSANMVGKLMGAQKTRDIIAGLAKRSGNTPEAIMKGANYAARGNGVMQGLKGADLIADELEAVGRQLRNQKLLMGATALFTDTFAEAKMEAINGVNEIYKPYIQNTEEARHKAIESTMNFMLEDDERNDDDKKWFEYIPAIGIDGTVQYKKQLTPLGQLEYNRRMASIEDSYTKTMESLGYEAAGAGNRIFETNVALLTLTNWLQLGKWYTGGFEANKWVGRNIVKNIVGKDGVEKAVKNKAIKRGMVTQMLLDNTIESIEEGGQGVIVKSEDAYSQGQMSEKMMRLALDRNFAQQLDFNTNEKVVNFAQAFAKGFNAYVGDPDNFIEMLYGFVTPLMLPGKVKVGTRKNGKPRYLPIPGGNIQQNMKDIKEYDKMADHLAEYINKNRDKFEGMSRGAAQMLEYEEIQRHALEIGDMEMYESAKHAQVITAAAMYHKAGMLEDYKARIEALSNPENLTDEYINGKGGVREIMNNIPVEEKKDEQLIHDITTGAKQALEDINAYEKIFKGLDAAFGNNIDFSADVMAELAWNAARAEKLERNMAGFAERAVNEINEMIDEANTNRAEDDQLQHINPASVLYTKNEGVVADEDRENSRGYKFDKFAEEVTKNEDIAKIASASLAYRQFVEADSRRNQFLEQFRQLYTHPETFTELFNEEKKKIENEILESFIKDVNEDMSDINTMEELKHAVNLQDIDLQTGLKVLEKLKQRTEDKSKQKLIDDYANGLKRYHQINNLLNALITQEAATNKDSIYVPMIEQMMKDLKKVYSNDNIATKEDVDKWIESKINQTEDMNENLGDEQNPGQIQGIYQKLNEELNVGFGIDPQQQFDDNNLNIKKNVDKKTGDVVYQINYHGNSGTLNGNELVEEDTPNIFNFIAQRELDAKNWKALKEALDKNQSEEERINIRQSTVQQQQIPIEMREDYPEWMQNLSNLDIQQLNVSDVRNGKIPEKTLEKLKEFGFDPNDQQDLQILEQWIKETKSPQEVTDGNTPSSEDNVQSGNEVRQKPNDGKTVMHGTGLTEFGIEQSKGEKQAESWAVSPITKEYINQMKLWGVYDFVNKGKLADLIRKNKGSYGLTMIYVKQHENTFINDSILLAVETPDGNFEINGKHFQIVGQLNALSNEKQKSGSEQGYDRDKQYTTEQKENSKTAYNNLETEIEAEMNSSEPSETQNDNYYVFNAKKAYVTQNDLFSGRMIINENQESLESVFNELKGNKNDVSFAIMVNGNPKFGYNEKIEHVQPNAHTQISRNGSLIMFAKAADGKYYPKAIRIKQFKASDMNDNKNNEAVQLDKQLNILFNDKESRFKRSSAKARIKKVIHFPAKDSNADRKYDIHFNGKVVKITDLNTRKEVISTENKDEFINKIEELGLRYQVSLKDLKDFNRMNQLASEGIIQSNLASAYNVNGSFDIQTENIRGNKPVNPQPNPQPAKQEGQPSPAGGQRAEIETRSIEMSMDGKKVVVSYNWNNNGNDGKIDDMNIKIGDKEYSFKGNKIISGNTPSEITKRGIYQMEYGNLHEAMYATINELIQGEQDTKPIEIKNQGGTKGYIFAEKGVVKFSKEQPGQREVSDPGQSPQQNSTQKAEEDSEKATKECNGTNQEQPTVNTGNTGNKTPTNAGNKRHNIRNL